MTPKQIQSCLNLGIYIPTSEIERALRDRDRDPEGDETQSGSVE